MLLVRWLLLRLLSCVLGHSLRPVFLLCLFLWFCSVLTLVLVSVLLFLIVCTSSCSRSWFCPWSLCFFSLALCTILGFHSVSLFSCSNASSSFYSFLVTSVCILSLENVDSKSLFLTNIPSPSVCINTPQSSSTSGRQMQSRVTALTSRTGRTQGALISCCCLTFKV